MDKKYELSQSIALFRTLDINEAYYGEISKAELSFLIVIYNLKNDVRSIDLSKYFNCSKVYVSKIINKLVSNGFIEIEIAKKDKRIKLIKLSDKGKNIVKKNMDNYMEKTNYLFDKLGEEKATLLNKLLVEATKILKGNNK